MRAKCLNCDWIGNIPHGCIDSGCPNCGYRSLVEVREVKGATP